MSAATVNAVEVSGLRIAYGDDVIMDALDLTIRQGEFLCVLGASGCGKSTTLRILGDLIRPTAGEVTVLGKTPDKAWSDLAYVFQSPRLLPWLSARDNVALAMKMRGVRGGRAAHRAAALEQLTQVGLGHVAGRRAHQLSGGERQRVAIARALAVQPGLLLMDEPFSALDVRTRLKLRSDIVQLWRESGVTVIFVTHDVDEAIALGTRIVVLSSRPAEVIHDVRIELPHPRRADSSDATALREVLVRGLDADGLTS